MEQDPKPLAAATNQENSLEDVVVFCDESGAKGYADKSEKEPGEIGVFAGFPIQRAETQDV
jgi:hypothetical protein